MSAYGTTENATHYSVSYLLAVSDSADPIRGWSLLLDPAVVGNDLTVGSVTVVRTDQDGNEAVVQVLPNTEAFPPTVTLLDVVEPGSLVLYNLTYAKLTTTPAAARHHHHLHRRQLQQGQPVASDRGVNVPATVWSEDAAAVTTLPPDLSGPQSAALASGRSACGASVSQLDAGGTSSGGDAGTDSTVPLLGTSGCIAATLSRAFSHNTNLTTLSMRVYGNASAAPGCAAWLAGVASPAFVGLRLTAGAAAAVAQAGSWRPRMAFFAADGTLVLPYRVRDGTGFTLSLTLPDPAAAPSPLSDVCQPGVLSEQQPGSCALSYISRESCASGTVADGASSGPPPPAATSQPGGTVSVESPPPPLSLPPPPPLPPAALSATAPPPPGNGRGQAGSEIEESGVGPGGSSGSSSGGLSPKHLALLITLVVGVTLLTILAIGVIMYKRRRLAWAARASDFADDTSSNSSALGPSPASRRGSHTLWVNVLAHRSSRRASSTGSSARSRSVASSVAAGGRGGGGGHAVPEPPRTAEFTVSLSRAGSGNDTHRAAGSDAPAPPDAVAGSVATSSTDSSGAVVVSAAAAAAVGRGAFSELLASDRRTVGGADTERGAAAPWAHVRTTR